MTAARPQGNRDVLGVHRRCAQQEHRPRRRLLDDLQQHIAGALGQPVGVLDEHHQPTSRARSAPRRLHDGTHLVHTDREPLRHHPAHVSMGARHRGRAWTARTAAGDVLRFALKCGGKTQSRHRPARTGRTGKQPCVRHSPRIVTACSQCRGRERGNHRSLIHQAPENPAHRLPTLVAGTDSNRLHTGV
ncbi:Uncharacterised protein [Mycobacteroides abscessus subsp. abscessus]|nr:Uncharacterised protein [Mycobacteroides abscessus subsp. abscessus]